MPNPNDLNGPPGKRKGNAASKGERIKAEYDFSKSERGKFYHPDAAFSFPIHFDPDISEFFRMPPKKEAD